MSRHKATFAIFLALLLGTLAPTGVHAATAPGWKLTTTSMPANFTPGGEGELYLVATNVGAGVTSGEAVTLKATLPPQFTPFSAKYSGSDPDASPEADCEVNAPVITCTTSDLIHSGRLFTALIKVKVSPAAAQGTVLTQASVRGGGAAQEVGEEAQTSIGPDPVPFGFLPGFGAPLSDEDGSATTASGSHPYQLTVDFGFPSENPGDGLTGSGHPRDISVELPRGLIGDPAATPVLCTEVELTSEACPEASQVGTVELTTLIGGVGGAVIGTSNLYSMVPTPGSPAVFGTNAAGIGIFIHLLGEVRSESDYGITSTSHDVLALGANPIFNVQAQIWGDPSSDDHALIRGACERLGFRPDGKGGTEPCTIEQQKTAFLTVPGDCSGSPLTFRALADSWEEPGPEHEARYESADLAGNPVSIGDCQGVQFDPEARIESRPTTNLTDSPSGLDFDLRQPQEMDLAGRSRAALKDALITFPTGMAVNPSQAGGLAACDPGQIGLTTPLGQSPAHFTKAPQSCPGAAKIGTVEVATPLLVERDAEHRVLRDPESGNPFPTPLHGSIYIAKPFQNPFGSLVAVYLVVEDPTTGISAKLAGEGELDPTTGQITTRFLESPELPLEDVRVHLFEGARGPLITPPTCTPQDTAATLTPWSSPEAPDAYLGDSFTPAATPIGGPCPTTEGQLPNSPTFSLGTTPPQAGAYSRLLFRLSRQDGSQRLGRIDLTLPSGLSARLAGTTQCSQGALEQAKARERPNAGALEQAIPSCPAASEVGVVDVGAGAGPTPYYAQGHAYLAGPYKGAPLSLAVITPAVAGPFDLGVVVVRVAIYLDPTTAQAHIVSDALPSILDGIPLDVRSVAMKVARPRFTLNPTSCNEKSATGVAVSLLGAAASLSERFQMGGCKSLPYKPKLNARLFGPVHRGGHPRFRTIFTAKPGEANTKRIVLSLPRSEFIDQGHFRTICTRVQFAASQCPTGSVYGHVKAVTPLLDYPLEGPVYLRSSVHKLPDAVLALRGPPSQPIEIDVVGRIDSINGGLRTTIETVPDAPLSKAIVTLRGAKRGLFQNSTHICKGTHRATLELNGQNGKTHDTKPLMKAECKGKKKTKRDSRARR